MNGYKNSGIIFAGFPSPQIGMNNLFLTRYRQSSKSIGIKGWMNE